jgi:hypothetical protein
MDPKKNDESDAGKDRNGKQERDGKRRDAKDDELPPPENYPPVVEYDD